MTDFQKAIITLIKCSITGKADPIPESFQLEESLSFAQKQHITTLVYSGAVICGFDKNSPAMQALFRMYIQQLLRSEQQLAEIKTLFQAFDEANIDYLPLKGVNMKKHYPKHELRIMGDVDILIQVEQYPRICPIMESLGYINQYESLHEHVWNKPNLHVELHKRLFASSEADLLAYFGNGWDRAVCENTHRYRYSPEDTYLFQFAHFAKHYRNTGIGCNHALDLWIYRRAYPHMNESYIRNELRKLHLEEFHDNMCSLLSFWFEDGVGSEKLEFMTDHIFSGGSWGTTENYFLSSAVKQNIKNGRNTKGKLLLKKSFPSLEIMQTLYPVLKNAPVFLPVFWIIRIIAAFFNKSKRTNAVYIMQRVTDKEIQTYQQAMQYVGLDFPKNI